MMGTEEKIEMMQRERIAYKEGYREGWHWGVILTGCLACVAIVIIIV